MVRRERTMVYLYSTSNFLWLVYGLVINEWVITFTTTFNLCLLSALISAKNRLRRAALEHCHAKGVYQGVAVLTHGNMFRPEHAWHVEHQPYRPFGFGEGPTRNPSLVQ